MKITRHFCGQVHNTIQIDLPGLGGQPNYQNMIDKYFTIIFDENYLKYKYYSLDNHNVIWLIFEILKEGISGVTVLSEIYKVSYYATVESEV